MRWPQTVFAVVSVCLVFVLFGVQIWLDGQELDRQRAEVARLKAEGEQQLARQKADFASCAVLLLILPLVQRHDPISPEAFRMTIWGLSAGAILFGALAIGLSLRAKRARKRA